MPSLVEMMQVSYFTVLFGSQEWVSETDTAGEKLKMSLTKRQTNQEIQRIQVYERE